jgi:hypothetical protein
MRSAAWAASRSPREAAGKAHLDIEPASGAGTWGHLGAVGVDDGADDGQAESMSVGVPDSLAAELPEGLEEALDLLGRDHRPGLPHRDARTACGRGGCHLDPPAGRVVARGTVHQARVTCPSAHGQGLACSPPGPWRPSLLGGLMLQVHDA